MPLRSPLLGMTGLSAPINLGKGLSNYVPPAPTPPVNLSLPSISGTSATVGETWSAVPGTWSGSAPTTFTYQWLRDASNIAGATGTSYDIQEADIGARIRCRVTATNPVSAVSALSAQTAVVEATTSPTSGIGSMAIGSTFIVG